MLRPRPEIIPDTLTAIPRWVAWKLETRDGKPTKVPYTPRSDERALSKASSTDPATWRDFPMSLHTLEHDATVTGIGFALNGDGLCGVDFDHCRDPDTGELNARVTRFLEMLNSYTEISPSGTGVRVFVHGELPKGPRKNTKEGIEMYADGRYLTVTGHHLEAYPVDVCEAQAALETMHAELFPTPVKPVAAAPRATSSANMDDHTLLEQARDAKNGAKFSRLYSGDFESAGYSSQSEADLALCGSLRFWTGGDMARVDTLFRLSGLMRPKWDKRHSSDGQTYGQMTLERVASDGGDVYTSENGVTRGGNKNTDTALEWGTRQPLPERPSVSTMPPEMIPEPLRAWLNDAARLSCVPLELLAVNAICAASGVIGTAVNIHARATFYTTPNLWGMGVAMSGTMKTASLKAATEPLRKLEQAAQQDASEAQEDHELEVNRAEAKYAALEKSYTTDKARKGDKVATAEEVKEAKRELTRLERSRSEERTYTTTNTTHEALGMLLKVNPKGVTVVRDELGPFIASMNREDMGEARGFFNASWDGDVPYKYQRVTREKVWLERVCVAFCGMIQPKVLDELMARMHADPMQNDGFLQRFQVLVYPDTYPEWTRPEEQEPATADALERAVRVFTALDQLEIREGESVNPRRLWFSSEAQPVFNEWHDEIEVRSRPGGALAADNAFKSWFMKTKSLCVNLAAIFHLIELSEHGTWGDQLEPISVDALNLSLDWCDYLTAHAQKVYALELHPEAHAARVVAALIDDGNIKTGTTPRDVKRGNRSTPPALLEAGLYELERLGWVRLEEVDTGGRPSEVIYLHPELVEVAR